MARRKKNPQSVHDRPLKVYLTRRQSKALSTLAAKAEKDKSRLVRDLIVVALDESA